MGARNATNILRLLGDKRADNELNIFTGEQQVWTSWAWVDTQPFMLLIVSALSIWKHLDTFKIDYYTFIISSA